jgi:1-aminocyclopropane-1-carboxylate synthase
LHRRLTDHTGQCYPRETLIGLLELCAAKGIHLISDEIYALTVYNRDDRPSEKFTSIRAIDYAGIIDPRQVHILYGMAKVRMENVGCPFDVH